MKWSSELLIIGLFCLYVFLASPNNSLTLFHIWSYLALVFALIWSIRLTSKNKPKSSTFKGFLLGSNLLMFPIHILWFFDIHSAQTSSSTNAVIFAVMPLWALILGVIGAFTAHLITKFILKTP